MLFFCEKNMIKVYTLANRLGEAGRESLRTTNLRRGQPAEWVA